MPGFISLLNNIRKRSILRLFVMLCIGYCLSYSQVTIKDTISISPVLQNNKVAKSLSATDCYNIVWGVDYDAVHYPAPKLSVIVNGITTNVLNCPYAYDGGYGSSVSASSSEFNLTVSLGSCQVSAELPTVNIVDVPPQPGELSAKEIWFIYPSSPCGGCGTTYYVGRAYSTYAESTPYPSIELSVTSSDESLPNSDNSLIIAPNNIPILHFSESHQSGSPCFPTTPVVTWNGPDTINLIDFYNSNKDSLIIPESATSYAHFKDGNPDHLVLSISAEITDQYGSSSSDIEVHVLLQEGCLTVVINNSNVANNETESFPSIRVMKKMKYGSIVDYPEGTLFDIDIMTGSNYGTLSTSEGDTSDHFENIPYALYFRPDTSYHGEQATVTIRGMISQLPSNDEASNSKKKKYKTATDMCDITGIINILPLHHFEISLANSDIAFSESTPINIYGKTLIGTPYNIKTEELIQLKINDASQFGTFIIPTNDTLKIDGAETEVTYSNIINNNILFAAVRTNPTILNNVVVTAKLKSKPSVVGEIIIEVKEKIIRIRTVNGANVVTPIIADVGSENKIEFEIGVSRGGIPQQNYSFRLDNIYLPSSGGHDHLATANIIRQKNANNYGSYDVDNSIIQAPVVNFTQETGTKRVKYIASIFGDIMLFTVKSTENVLMWDTISVFEKIEGLEELPQSVDYGLIGGRDEHSLQHNHFATHEVISNIQNIANGYHLRTTLKISINDMSLPYGGRFDLSGKWSGNSRHQHHRQGTDVDIRSTNIEDDDKYIDLNQNGKYDEIDQLTIDINNNGKYDYSSSYFEMLCEKYNAKSIDLEYPGESNEHYHLYFHEY